MYYDSSKIYHLNTCIDMIIEKYDYMGQSDN